MKTEKVKVGYNVKLKAAEDWAVEFMKGDLTIWL